MKIRCFAAAAALWSLASTAGYAQEGRVFGSTPETIAIWEFNDLEALPGDPLPVGAVFPDLSGHGLDAVVVANGGNSLTYAQGDAAYGDSTFAVARTAGDGGARIEVEDQGPFQLEPGDDFSFELFFRREETAATANWGILAGTWHSRTLLDDGGDPIANGAWYGFGYIANPNAGQHFWQLVTSPINTDGTFNPGFNEPAAGPFEITAGTHYLVASFDSTNALISVYLDGNPVGQVAYPQDRALITPTGYEPARFAFLTGVDDASRGAYRAAPTGYVIDAARVMSRAISEDEAVDNWFGMLDGETVPLDGAEATQAILTLSTRNALVGECVELSAVNSVAEAGRTITSYEFKVGDGPFEAGERVRELSFDTPSPAEGIDITLRITDSGGTTSEATGNVVVRNASVDPVAIVRLGDDVLVGDSILAVAGDVLSLDATSSSTQFKPGALQCPSDAGVPLDPPAIVEYRWDLDGDGADDSMDAVTETDPLSGPGTFAITLSVVSAQGVEGVRMIEVEVLEAPDVAPAPPGRIFLPTPETIGIWEFNDLDLLLGDPIPSDHVFEDLSGNGNDAVVESNDIGELVLEEGDGRFDDNTSIQKSFAGVGRVAVQASEEEFELDETEDLSIELYVRRAETVGTENWGILAGTWHSRTLLDDAGNPDTDGAWYGYGFILDNDNGGWVFNSSPINPDRTFTPSFNEIKTTPNVPIPQGQHYLVGVIDRTAQRASVYLDGELRAGVNLPAGQPFFTPTDYDPARFLFFAGEDDLSRGSYRPAPSGYGVDAARVQRRAIGAEEVLDNWRNIRSGVAVPPEEPPVGGGFQRGDADASGAINITDGIFVLNFLFLGGPAPSCADAGDADDSGAMNITDGIFVLNFLFLGGSAPPAPYPECGPDSTDDALDCVAFAPCA